MTERSNAETPFRAVGVTDAERYLARLCKQSFLSLWSYPAVYRDQGRRNGKGDGKELCDLLVVFENHVFIFSDKDCEFRDGGDLNLEWKRWYKKAVFKSAEQVFGAERWIKQFPSNLYLDRQCTVPFPINLPAPEGAIFHRIVIAHDGARRCQEALGGSGSLMLDNRATGSDHLFTIGQVDKRGFVHVFDDTTLRIVMSQLDTISDFTAYIAKKEQFLTNDKHVAAAGEEELLAVYLARLNERGEHDFLPKGKYDSIRFAEGFWTHFVNSPEYKTQKQADRISYFWDTLIERFLHHAVTGTQYFTSGRPLHEQEEMYRVMAKEPRTRRRMLSKSIRDVLERSETSGSVMDARVIAPSNPGDPYYVFLCVRRLPDFSDEDYRKVRKQLVSDYCHVVKLDWRNAKLILGIATESGIHVEPRSEDLCYLDTSNWDTEAEAYARQVRERSGILKKTKLGRGIEHEYPVDHEGYPRDSVPSRNSKCRCGSGKRFRYCHGRKFFPKTKGH